MIIIQACVQYVGGVLETGILKGVYMTKQQKEVEIQYFIEQHKKEINGLRRYAVQHYLFRERYVEIGVKLNIPDDPSSWSVDIAENEESEAEFYAVYCFEGIGEYVADNYDNMTFLRKNEVFRDGNLFLDHDRNIVNDTRFKVIVPEQEMRKRILQYYLQTELK